MEKEIQRNVKRQNVEFCTIMNTAQKDYLKSYFMLLISLNRHDKTIE